MNILTVENNVYNLDSVPDQIDDLRYCVLDVTDPEYYDYFWHPLVFLESFYSPAMVLNIGGKEIQMPMDWSIAICDDDAHSEIEIIPLTSLNNRGFKTPVFNPMDNKIHKIEEVFITNIYQEVKWFFPKLKHGHLLVTPIENKNVPKSVLFVKEANKIPDPVDLSDVF